MASDPIPLFRPRTAVNAPAGGFGLGATALQRAPREDPGDTPIANAPDAPDEIDAGDNAAVVSTSDGELVQIHDDGSVSIGVHRPSRRSSRIDDKFDSNLALELDDGDMMTVADMIMQGIDADEMSRSSLVENYVKGIDLLGLKLASPGDQRGRRTSISKVGHPLLLEACTKYQATASAELLPAGGPAKVVVSGDDDSGTDDLARAFEQDFNYFLTDIAKEYYPDTRRAMFYQAYGGVVYKKVYFCPLKRRPTSESVYLSDLIVSEDATSLDTALRVTHQSYQIAAHIKRMQLAGMYRDVELGPATGVVDPVRMKILESQGLSPMSTRMQDQPHRIFECDVDVLPDELGANWQWERKAPEGLPLPYKITIDADSRKVLAVWRNWRDGDPAYLKRNMYVKFGLVPGLGFHDYGFLHLLGNQTLALRSIWRVLIDAGYFSNFPAGVKVAGVRMSTNEIAPGPGEWPDIDVPQTDDIRKVMMALPYKEPSAVFIQLAEMIQQGYQQLAGTVELPVGEGQTNVPVGTILAQIEQQTQVMGSVHKANHVAQKEELVKLRELFVENPASLTMLARKPARQWQVGAEFADLDLQPKSDPNVPSQTHRIMLATAVATLAAQNPTTMNVPAALKNVLSTVGVSASTVSELIPPPTPPAPPPPDPKIAVAQIKAQSEQGKQAIDAQQQQREAAQAEVENQQHSQELAASTASEAAANESKERIAAMQEQTEGLKAQVQLVTAQAHLQAAQPAVGTATPAGFG